MTYREFCESGELCSRDLPCGTPRCRTDVRRECCDSPDGQPHAPTCEAEPRGDLPGMAGWWSGGIADNH